MKKDLLYIIPPNDQGYDNKVTFPILCSGNEKDAVSVTFNKLVIAEFEKQHKAGLLPSDVVTADDYFRLLESIYSGFNKGVLTDGHTSIAPANTLLNTIIKLVGGYRHQEGEGGFEPSPMLNIKWQHWNDMQAAFAADPARFIHFLRNANFSPIRFRSSETATSNFIRNEDLNPDFFKNGAIHFPIIDKSLNENKGALAFVTTDAFQDTIAAFDHMRLVGIPTFAKSKDTTGMYDVGYLSLDMMNPFTLKHYEYAKSNRSEQLSLLGQYIKTEANRDFAQSNSPEVANSFKLGTISDLYARKSAGHDALSDSFAKLLSSNYYVPFRGIFSGALFIQLDDFTRKFGNIISNYDGYKNFISSFCGGEQFYESYLIHDLNDLGAYYDCDWVKNPITSIAREFSITNIHTKRVYLVSIGEHRFTGQEYWRHQNVNGHPRFPTLDFTTSRIAFNNDVLSLIDNYAATEIEESDPSHAWTIKNSALIRHIFAVKEGRGMTSIHAIDDSSCLKGASIMHTPLSGQNDEFADDDQNAIQYGLNYSSPLNYVQNIDYELKKGVEQCKVVAEIIMGIIQTEGSVIKEVLDFNISKAVFLADSTFGTDPESKQTAFDNLRSLVDRHHFVLWCATHASLPELTPDTIPFYDLPQPLQDTIRAERQIVGHSDNLRDPARVHESYNAVIEALAYISSQLDTNHNSNIFISQSMRLYSEADGLAPKIPWIADFSELSIDYLSLKSYVFFNIGTHVDVKPFHNGIPVLKNLNEPVVAVPHTLPFGIGYDWFSNNIDPLLVRRLVCGIILGIDGSSGLGWGDKSETPLFGKNELLVVDANQFFFDINTINSLPLVFLSMMADRDGLFKIQANNPLISTCATVGHDDKLGFVTTAGDEDINQQTSFNFNPSLVPRGELPVHTVLSLLAMTYGVTNFDGKTGLFLNSLTTPIRNSDNEILNNKSILYLREFACAIHADTMILPCTSQLVKDLISVNQGLFDLDFNFHVGLHPSYFSNEEKEYMIARAHKIEKTSFNRISSLFLYDSYK